MTRHFKKTLQVSEFDSVVNHRRRPIVILIFANSRLAYAN
ncbi:hypothetical protein MRBBS_1261 [Marinobacter sp. BSs20148]|nr:hypothetical protein MRBBS_1261 [Marinobacter sp. BSs20148]